MALAVVNLPAGTPNLMLMDWIAESYLSGIGSVELVIQ